MNVIGAAVLEHSRNGMALVKKESYTILYSKNSEEWSMWFEALKLASRHKLETYYLVKRVIGEGGFALVRLGIERATRTLVAVKTIEKHKSTAAFLHREVSILKEVSHPNVVETFDVFTTERKYHIVMEYMNGGTLFDELNKRTKFSENDARQIIHQILQGVSYLHSHGIIHRDLKPENVLHTAVGGLDVKLADFGLSNFYDTASETLMKTMIGTPQFVAPEMVKNEEYGGEVDLWAVGVILFNLLTGNPPFSENVVLEKYASGQFSIPYQKKAWRNLSKQALRLTKQLLCTKVSCRLSATGALQHDWFATLKANDCNVEVEPQLTKSFRYAVHAVCFLLRLRSKGGLLDQSFEFMPLLERADSLSSYGSGGSGISLGGSEWDFDIQAFGDMDACSFDKQDPDSSTSNELIKTTKDDRKREILKELSMKLAESESRTHDGPSSAKYTNGTVRAASMGLGLGRGNILETNSYTFGSRSKGTPNKRSTVAHRMRVVDQLHSPERLPTSSVLTDKKENGHSRAKTSPRLDFEDSVGKGDEKILHAKTGKRSKRGGTPSNSSNLQRAKNWFSNTFHG